MKTADIALTVNDVIETIGFTDDEVISALLTAAAPPDLQNASDRVEITQQEVWDLLESTNFSCQKCDTKLRVGIIRDLYGDIKVLCAYCQQTGYGPKQNRDRKLDAFLAAMKLYKLNRTFPSMAEVTNEVRRCGNPTFTTSGGIPTFLKWLALKLTGDNQNIVRKYTTNIRPLRGRPSAPVQIEGETAKDRIAAALAKCEFLVELPLPGAK